MDHQEMWNKLKNDLSESIKNLTEMVDMYNKNYESTKARVTNRKCKEYKNIYNKMVELEGR